MTTQNPHGSSDNETADLVRSVAISSARLWEEVLERLVRVERSQAELTQTLARLQSALPTGSVTPELSSASNAALPAAALPPPPSRTSPIEVNGLEINGRQPSLGSAPEHVADAGSSWTTPSEPVSAASPPAPPVLSGSTPVLDLSGSAGPSLDPSLPVGGAPVAWEAAPVAPTASEFAEPLAAAAPPPPPPGFAGPDSAFPPPPPHDLHFAPTEGPGDFLAEGPGEPVEAPRSRRFSLRRKSSKKGAAADPIAESMADSILAASEGGAPGFDNPQPALAGGTAPALADLPPPPAAFAPTLPAEPTPPPVWNGVTEASATAPDSGAFAGLHAVQPAASPAPEHPAFGGPDTAFAPVEAEEPRWTAPAPPDPAWSVTPPPPAVPTEQTWAATPAASVAPPPPPMAPVPPTVMTNVPESPFASQPQAAQAPASPFVEPQVAQATPSPFVEPQVAPSPFVEPQVAQAPAPAASPFVEPQAAPSPFVEPQIAQAQVPTASPFVEPQVAPSPFVEPPAAPAGFSLEDLQGAGAIGAPAPPMAAPVAPAAADAPPPAPAGFSLEDLQGEGAIGAPMPPVAAPPPPPPGFANQPASIESLGLDPEPAPSWDTAVPGGFAAAPVDPFAPQGAPAPPPPVGFEAPPVGFEAPPVGFEAPVADAFPSAPPPPAGFSTADFSGTGAIGGSIADAAPAPSAATLMGGEVPEPPITPDFFARAGRKRR